MAMKCSKDCEYPSCRRADRRDNTATAYAVSTIGLENPAFYSDADLTHIIRKAVYMNLSSSYEGNMSHNGYQNGYYTRPLPAVPTQSAQSTLTTLPSFAVNHNQQRLRNEIIASAATLPSMGSSRKRALCGFREMRSHDTHCDNHNKNRTTIFCLAVLVICLAVAVVGISALTYWTVGRNLHPNWDVEYTGDAKLSNSNTVKVEDERGSKIIFGEFTISNRIFSDALTSGSQQFQSLEAEVIQSLDQLFLESPLARLYNSTHILSFSQSHPSGNGVIVRCGISLNIPLLTAAQEIGLTFIQSLELGHGRLPGGKLRVDIRTIKFTALSGSAPPPVVTANAGTSDAQSVPVITQNESSENVKAEWSNWSEWSPCRGVNSKCDPGRIHSRIRKCISENGEVVNSDICRLANGEQQELEIRDCRCDEESNMRAHNGYDNSNKNNISTITDEPSHSSNIEQRDGACNDCNENEICLLQVKAAVPFCAKVKDPRDPRGCGGWCAGHKELCRYVGANTYQCVDDSECLEDEWQCANGLCIPHSRRCDGHFNCFDMSDELHCECKDDEFHCGNKTSCVPLSQRCDGIIHCWDGEDEQNCTKLCSETQFTCNSGQCIPLDYFCDGRYRHCDDGSDEPVGCNETCISGERQCARGKCISESAFCDGIDDCGDNSDEIDCHRTTTTSPSINAAKSVAKDMPHDMSHFATINNNNNRTSAPSTTSESLIRSKQLFNRNANANTTLFAITASPQASHNNITTKTTTKPNAKQNDN